MRVVVAHTVFLAEYGDICTLGGRGAARAVTTSPQTRGSA